MRGKVSVCVVCAARVLCNFVDGAKLLLGWRGRVRGDVLVVCSESGLKSFVVLLFTCVEQNFSAPLLAFVESRVTLVRCAMFALDTDRRRKIEPDDEQKYAPNRRDLVFHVVEKVSRCFYVSSGSPRHDHGVEKVSRCFYVIVWIAPARPAEDLHQA